MPTEPHNPTSLPSAETPTTPTGDFRPGCVSYFLFAVTSLWIILVSVLVQTGAWLVEQFLLVQGMSMPAFGWPLISWGHGLLLALPVLPLAIFTRPPRLRAAYQTWALAVGFLAVLGFARFFPLTWTQPAALAEIGLSLSCVALLAVWARRSGPQLERQSSTLVPALAVAPATIAPWLALGALGSPLDTLLNLLAGLGLGLFAGVLLGVFLVPPLSEHSSGTRWDIAFGGLAAGVALTILGAGFGFEGSQLLLLVSLPALGFAAVALGRAPERGRDSTPCRWLAMAILIGLAAAAPLVFVDPDELTLLLGDRDEILGWAFRAAGFALLLACGAGLALGILHHRLATPLSPRAASGLLGVMWIGSLLFYFVVGKPGFYGEQLFVILRQQADLRPAYAMADRSQRLRFVYATLSQDALRTQASLRSTLDRLHVSYQPYYLVNGLEVDGGPILRAYLSRQPEVDRILDSPHLRPLPRPLPRNTGNEPAPTRPPWNIRSTGADRVWRELGVTGQGIIVGQSDSGVQGDHPALRDGYRGRNGGDDYNWLDSWNGTRSPTDVGGHGTHTLGSILGRGDIGVAPGAEWFGCVNLARNLGNPAEYLNCLQFMLAPYPQGGDPFVDGDPGRAAHVINNSWGCPPLEGCDANSLAPATSALWAAGIFVVASAGNEGPRCGSVSDPIAIYADAFTVGAVDESGNVAQFSSRGPVTVDGSGRVKPDIVAPGVGVLSSFPGNTYAFEDGTSMAGPHVVGVVALMWSAQPKLTGDVERTERILMETARPYNGGRQGCFEGGLPNHAFGYGILDAYAAVKAALNEEIERTGP